MGFIDVKIGKVIIKASECCVELIPKYKLDLTLSFSKTIKLKSNKMAVTLSTIEQVSGQVTPTNAKGGPAQVESGSVEYSTSDASIADVVEDPNDETKFLIVAKSVGVAQVNVSADADLGAGVETITAFVAVEVLPAGATGFGLSFGTPEIQP